MSKIVSPAADAKPTLSKETLLPLLAAHVLHHGLAGASLRVLAKAADTSDRMLIYHFGNKQNLITDLLRYLADQYAQSLASGMGDDRAKTRQECVARILAQGREETMQPFLILWWEIVAGASRGVVGYKDAAHAMMAQLLLWLEGQMPDDDPDPVGGARYLLTLIEGSLMLNAIGHTRTARAGLLASGLDE
ncbi:MAG: TetR/AcrR family transcriptional regulator [Erythrobacter sp.]